MRCSLCYKVFESVSALLQHIRVLHPLQPKYSCVYGNCVRQFISISTLTKHVSTCNKNVACVVAVKKNDDRKEVDQCAIRDKKMFFSSIVSLPSINEINIHDEQKRIEKTLFEFIAKLYGNTSITNVTVNEVVLAFENVLSGITDSTKNILKCKVPLQFHQLIDESFDLSITEKFKTEYRRLQYFKRNGCFISPIKFFIGKIHDNKKTKSNTIWTEKTCYGYYVPMRTVLEKFMELPNVYDDINNFMRDEISSYDKNIYSSVFHGSCWQKISTAFDNKFVVPLFLYFDDFEVCDPLSTAAGIHKIGALYYSIAGLSPEYSSLVENVFLAQFVFTHDQSEFKNEKCFSKVIEEIKLLFTEGISVCVNGKTLRVYFIVLGILGDNLGLNSLLGFTTCFVAQYYCRFCTAEKYKTHSSCEENKALIRTVETYCNDLISKTRGIKESCVFNDMPYFHSTINWTCDIMHDFFLGICRYDMARIINSCIKKKYFTLDRLNDRLKYFDFSELDHGNKISSISQKHIQNGCLIITAAEMSALVTYFSIIMSDLIPDDEPVWELYLSLYDVIVVVTSPVISKPEILYLRSLIKCHHEMYIDIFEESLKSKHHLILHYPTCIEAMGPPRFYSCSKFEAYHRLSKQYAHVVTSRVNIIYTVANKVQLKFAYRLYIKKGLKTTIEFGSMQERNCNYLKKNNFQKQVSYVKINGSMFKPQYAILISDSENPVFGIITKIFKNNKNDIFISYVQCVTIGFLDHIKAYHIFLPDEKTEEVFKLNLKKYTKPIKIHITGEGLYVIVRRDL